MAGLSLPVRALVSGLLLATPVAAQVIELAPAMKPLRFLVGRWEGGGDVSDGNGADANGRATGRSSISIEADGRVLLRRDQNEVFDKAGARTQAFDQLMVIYAEGAAVKADYMDGEGHVIHYGPADVVAGRSVEFTSTAAVGAPTFRLRYDVVDADRLKVAFTIRPPGQTGFQPIAVGELHRARR